jgi:hypothetical protein
LGRTSTGWIAPACLAHSFDHLIGGDLQRERHFYAQRLCGFRLMTSSNLVGVDRTVDLVFVRVPPIPPYGIYVSATVEPRAGLKLVKFYSLTLAPALDLHP